MGTKEKSMTSDENGPAREPEGGAAKILLVEDDQNSREGLAEFLSIESFDVTAVDCLAEARRAAADADFDLFLLDLNLPDGSGLDLAREALAADPEAMVVIITAYGTVSTAVQAMKEGVHDYIQKPITDLDELLLVIGKGIEARRLKRENLDLKSELKSRFSFSGIKGDSGAMQEVLKKIERVCRTSATVLVRGESGTGKELVARALHYNSPRKDGPFVPVNCPSFPESLLESELFGHRKGAFTGAIKDKRGLFEAAHHGSLFLDEIGEMSLSVQSKLLRVLEGKTFTKVGDDRETQVDVRIIAATNRDIEKAAGEKRFRPDLFYRLSVVPIVLPPLSSRPEDIAPLMEHFTEKHCRELGLGARRFSRKAMERLLAYSWPGNVRELQNLVESILITCDGPEIGEEMLPSRFGPGTGAPAAEGDGPKKLGDLIDRYEGRILEDALKQNDGSRRDTAKYLGISLRTLQYKLKKHGFK